MVRSFNRAVCALLAAVSLGNVCLAQNKAAYDLLPPNTQAVLWIRDGEELLDRWERTQLFELVSDESVAPFFEEQRQEIEKRLMEAGWRLNIKPEDLRDYAVGQVALAWTDKEDAPLKPFALALLVDVEEDAQVNEKMLAEIEAQLDEKKTKKTKLRHGNIAITKYALPPRAGELIGQDSYIAIHNGLLMATDDEAMLKDLIDRNLAEEVSADVLSSEEAFVKGRELAKISGVGQIEYFVRPLGFARVIRAIGGKRSKNSADMLAVLANQGFDSIQCVCGELMLGQPALDIQHRGYVYAQRPLPKSAGVLDFVNQVGRNVPNFVSDRVSSFLATNWNAKEAFWKTEGLVDEIAGTEGVFDEVIDGIKKDPHGPQIDIREDVLPLLTNQIYAISDNKEGDAEVDSRRNLIALEVNDTEAMAEVLNKAMKGEPDAELVEYDGIQIWQVVHREDEDILVEGIEDFGDFGDADFGEEEDEPEPWLSNWAITVHDGYLMFASHVELIEDAIEQASTGKVSPLVNSKDYQRVTAAIAKFFGSNEACAWQIMRADRAYRVQYELFRQGELRRSQSMLASILDRLLQSENEIRDTEQKIDGSDLPPFEKISKYLQPSGVMVRTTDDGWEFGSLLLSAAFSDSDEVSQVKQLGTARVSTEETEAKR